jgi:hypothetical protein
MKRKMLISVVFLSALAAQDRFTLKAPNGIAVSEFIGYEMRQCVAPSCATVIRTQRRRKP